MLDLQLELIGQASVRVQNRAEVVQALQAVQAAPHPTLTLTDADGRLLRVEGHKNRLLLDLRIFEGINVAWFAVGTTPPSEDQSSVPLAGWHRPVRTSETLDEARTTAAVFEFLETGNVDGATFGLRSLLNVDLGRVVVLAAADRDPRRTGSWDEINRFVRDLPERGTIGFAVAHPERSLVGVLGDGRRFALRVRQARGRLVREASVRRREPDPSRTDLELDSPTSFPADQILSRPELLAVLGSWARYEALPPGYCA